MQFYSSRGDWWLLRWITRWIFLSVYYTSFPFFSYCQIHCHFSRQSIKFCLTTLCTLLFFLHFDVRARWMEALLRHSNITVHMEDTWWLFSPAFSFANTLTAYVCARVSGMLHLKKIVCLYQGIQEYFYLHIYFLILLIKKIFFWLLSVTDVIYWHSNLKHFISSHQIFAQWSILKRGLDLIWMQVAHKNLKGGLLGSLPATVVALHDS